MVAKKVGQLRSRWHGLSSHPSSGFGLHGAAQDAQHGGRHRMTDAAAVFPRTHVEGIVGAVFNAPVRAHQFEQAHGVGLCRGEAQDDPDRFDFLLAVPEFADAVHTRDLRDVGEAHLMGRNLQDLNAAPLDAAVSGAYGGC